MKMTEKLVKKEEKDGVIETVKKVVECKTYWVHEYFNKNTGSFNSFTFDEEGEIVEGVGCSATESVKTAFED